MTRIPLITRYNQMEKMLAQLLEVWELHPSWRLGQLISNLHGTGPQDVFHTSDATMERWLAEALLDYFDDQTQDPDPTQ